MTRQSFERTLERCGADPQFESRLRSAYRGRHDLLDALWWAAHPLTVTPRGIPDPAAELRALQNAVFSREAGASPIVEVTDPITGAAVRMRETELRLQEAQRSLAEDAAHLSAALDAVESVSAASVEQEATEVPDRPPVRRFERETRAIPAQAPAGPAPSTIADEPAQEEYGVIAAPGGTTARVRRLLLPVLSGVALLAAIVILPSVTGMNAGTGGAPTPSFSQAPRITTEIVSLDADGNVPDPLSILERPQTEADLPPEGFPVQDTDSYRKLPDLVGHVQLFLAREGKATVCLVAVRNDRTGMSGCIEESRFPEQGIWLGGGEGYSIGPDMTILTESFSLLANGDFHYEATARVTQPDQPQL